MINASALSVAAARHGGVVQSASLTEARKRRSGDAATVFAAYDSNACA